MTKEFNLSEKRKQLRKDCQEFSANSILDLIEQQDKEFIRLVKEELDTFKNRALWSGESVDYLLKQIDKLAGDKLKGDEKEEFFETIITQEMYEDMIEKPEIIKIINRLPYNENFLKVRFKRKLTGDKK